MLKWKCKKKKLAKGLEWMKNTLNYIDAFIGWTLVELSGVWEKKMKKIKWSVKIEIKKIERDEEESVRITF